MPGQFDFRNDRDIPVCGVRDDFTDLIFGIKPTVARAVSFRSPSASGGQFRIRIHFNAPALIFC